MTRQTHVRIGHTIAKECPQFWEIIQHGYREDFDKMMDLLMQVTVNKIPLAEAAKSFGAIVYKR